MISIVPAAAFLDTAHAPDCSFCRARSASHSWCSARFAFDSLVTARFASHSWRSASLLVSGPPDGSFDLRRRRRGSVSTMTPHYCVCGLKKSTHNVHIVTKNRRICSPSLLSLPSHEFSQRFVKQGHAAYHRDSAPLYAARSGLGLRLL